MSTKYKVEVYPINYSGEESWLVHSLHSRGIHHTIEPSGEFSRVTFVIQSDADIERVRNEIRHWLLSLHLSSVAGPDGIVSRHFDVSEV